MIEPTDERPIAGEVQQSDGDRWRTVHLGDNVPVRDRRRVAVDREPMFPRLRPGEVVGTREISPAERELLDRVAQHLIPLPPGADDLTWREIGDVQ